MALLLPRSLALPVPQATSRAPLHSILHLVGACLCRRWNTSPSALGEENQGVASSRRCTHRPSGGGRDRSTTARTTKRARKCHPRSRWAVALALMRLTLCNRLMDTVRTCEHRFSPCLGVAVRMTHQVIPCPFQHSLHVIRWRHITTAP